MLVSLCLRIFASLTIEFPFLTLDMLPELPNSKQSHKGYKKLTVVKCEIKFKSDSSLKNILVADKRIAVKRHGRCVGA